MSELNGRRESLFGLIRMQLYSIRRQMIVLSAVLSLICLITSLRVYLTADGLELTSELQASNIVVSLLWGNSRPPELINLESMSSAFEIPFLWIFIQTTFLSLIFFKLPSGIKTQLLVRSYSKRKILIADIISFTIVYLFLLVIIIGSIGIACLAFRIKPSLVPTGSLPIVAGISPDPLSDFISNFWIDVISIVCAQYFYVLFWYVLTQVVRTEVIFGLASAATLSGIFVANDFMPASYLMYGRYFDLLYGREVIYSAKTSLYFGLLLLIISSLVIIYLQHKSNHQDIL